MIDQPQPDELAARRQHIEIPKEQMPLVLNSLIAEHVMGFERRLNTTTGNHEWSGKQEDGTVLDWAEAPPFDFARDDSLAVALASRICVENGYFIDFQISPEGVFWARLGERLPEDPQSARMIAGPATGKPLCLVLCLLICTARKLSVPGQHRTLFPGHYMKLQ